MAKVFIEETTLTAIGDAIRGKEGTTELIPTTDMASRITAIESGGGSELTDEDLTFTGSASYMFAYKCWDWFIEKFGDRITTKDLTYCNYVFKDSNIETIPFEINCKSGISHTIEFMFDGAQYLTEVPKINNCKPSSARNLFYGCKRLRYLPEDIADWFDWSNIESQTNGSNGPRNQTFYNCYSLRSIPMEFLNHVNKNSSYNNSIYSNGFTNCYALDEIVGLPAPYTSTWTSNAFASTFSGCNRLKNMTFALNPSTNAPYVMNWKTQTIDLSLYVGYANGWGGIYNDGIDAATKRIKDDATYQALKNDPDWYTTSVEYSRYNHDSAVATINSLPDTSAYLASAGGTNTIKFKGTAGSATDGGAINTLTEEEIAVATAKGWTVTLV